MSTRPSAVNAASSMWTASDLPDHDVVLTRGLAARSVTI